jgi:hypothetical protein
MGKGPWSDEENDLIVADYFAMLGDDEAGRSYSKRDHNRRLQSLIGRKPGSIEFKHQNISAVLKGMGEDWIVGYKPASNYQGSLEEAVQRWLARMPAWLERTPAHLAADGFKAPPTLWFEPPPTHSNQPPPDELDQMMAVARKFDVAGRDERNRVLGRAGENIIYDHEKATLRSAGRQDLAGKVRWVSQDEGDGAGYDIASYTPEGQPRLIEVKTTNGWERTPFHISRNELAVAEARRDAWQIVRLWNFARTPRAFELKPPLDRHVSLTATSFLASFH